MRLDSEYLRYVVEHLASLGSHPLGFRVAVAPLVRFYGGANPTDWLQSERYEDCAAP